MNKNYGEYILMNIQYENINHYYIIIYDIKIQKNKI